MLILLAARVDRRVGSLEGWFGCNGVDAKNMDNASCASSAGQKITFPTIATPGTPGESGISPIALEDPFPKGMGCGNHMEGFLLCCEPRGSMIEGGFPLTLKNNPLHLNFRSDDIKVGLSQIRPVPRGCDTL